MWKNNTIIPKKIHHQQINKQPSNKKNATFPPVFCRFFSFLCTDWNYTLLPFWKNEKYWIGEKFEFMVNFRENGCKFQKYSWKSLELENKGWFLFPFAKKITKNIIKWRIDSKIDCWFFRIWYFLQCSLGSSAMCLFSVFCNVFLFCRYNR